MDRRCKVPRLIPTKHNYGIKLIIDQELDIETGKVLFEWSSLEHVDPSGTFLIYNLMYLSPY